MVEANCFTMECTLLCIVYGLLDLLFCIIDKCLKMCTMKWTRVPIVKNIIDALLSLMHQRMQQGSKPTRLLLVVDCMPI